MLNPNHTPAPPGTRCGRCGTHAARLNGPAVHEWRGRLYCAYHSPFDVEPARRIMQYGAYTLSGPVVDQGYQWVTIMVEWQYDAQSGQPSTTPHLVGQARTAAIKDTAPLR